MIILGGLSTEKFMNARTEQALLEKLKTLPEDRLAEVEDFVDFLCTRDETHRLTAAATRLSEGTFAKVWNNTEDAEYDKL